MMKDTLCRSCGASTSGLCLGGVQLMQGYQAATGKNLSSHDFRRAAFTRAAENAPAFGAWPWVVSDGVLPGVAILGAGRSRPFTDSISASAIEDLRSRTLPHFPTPFKRLTAIAVSLFSTAFEAEKRDTHFAVAEISQPFQKVWDLADPAGGQKKPTPRKCLPARGL